MVGLTAVYVNHYESFYITGFIQVFQLFFNIQTKMDYNLFILFVKVPAENKK